MSKPQVITHPDRGFPLYDTPDGLPPKGHPDYYRALAVLSEKIPKNIFDSKVKKGGKRTSRKSRKSRKSK